MEKTERNNPIKAKPGKKAQDRLEEKAAAKEAAAEADEAAKVAAAEAEEAAKAAAAKQQQLQLKKKWLKNQLQKKWLQKHQKKMPLNNK